MQLVGALRFKSISLTRHNIILCHSLSCSDENGDPESGGGGSATALVEKGPPTSVIVPIYRRDCHQGASP